MLVYIRQENCYVAEVSYSRLWPRVGCGHRREDLNLNGKIKSVDVDGKSLVVTPDDKAISDTTFKVTDKTSIVRKSKDGGKDVKDGLKGLKEGRAVTVTTSSRIRIMWEQDSRNRLRQGAEEGRARRRKSRRRKSRRRAKRTRRVALLPVFVPCGSFPRPRMGTRTGNPFDRIGSFGQPITFCEVLP